MIALLTSTALPTDPTALALSALLGLIGAGAYLAYFTGLRVGPIAVVSGVVAAYGGLTVVLSVVLRGETLTTLQALGAAIATIGVILTGIAFEGALAQHPARRARRHLLDRRAGPVRDDGDHDGRRHRLRGLAPGPARLEGRQRDPRARRRGHRRVARGADGLEADAGRPVGRTPTIAPSRRVAGRPCVLAGVLDVAGLAVVRATGSRSRPTWLVGLASSFGPAVTILIAVAFLGERLKPIQWFGLSGVAVGMIAIAIP